MILPRRATLLAALLVLTASLRAHSPHDVVNQVALGPMLDGQLVVFAKVTLTGHKLLGRSFDGGRSWSVAGLPVVYRDISDLALSPSWTTGRHAFISTLDAGLLKTVNGGDRWTPVVDPVLDPNQLSVTLSPTYPSDGRVLVTTINGAFVSDDEGATWTPSTTGLVETALFQSAWGRTAGGGSALFTGDRTIHRSDDEGATWAPLHTFPERINALRVSPRFPSDETLLVSLRNGAGVFHSQDGGVSWSPMVDGLSEPVVNDVELAFDGTCYAVTRTDGLFRAPSPGASWEPVGQGWEALSDLTSNHFRSVALSPSFGADDTVFVGSFEGLFRSTDRGDAVRQLDLYGQGFNRRVVPSPEFGQDGQLFLVNYGGGPYRTAYGALGSTGGSGGPPPAHRGSQSGGGPTVGPGHGQAAPDETLLVPAWRALGRDMDVLFGQELVLSPDFVQDQTLFYAQVGLFRSDDAGAHWTSLPLPPGVDVVRTLALSPSFPDEPLIFLGAGLSGGAWRSEDAGQTWQQLQAGLPAEPHPNVFSVSPDFAQDRTVFLGTKDQGLFRSADGGATWVDVGGDLADPQVRTVTLSPDFASDGLVVLGLAREGLARSVDGGFTFTPANTGLPASLPLDVEGVVISPDFAVDDTLFAATLAAGVHRSTDGGLSWTKVGPGLPGTAPRTLGISPAYGQDATVFVSTYDWVYRSTDGGSSFQRMPGYSRIDDLNLVQVYTAGGGEGDLTGATPITRNLPPALCVGGVSAVGGAGSTAAEEGGEAWEEVSYTGAHGGSVSLSSTPGDSVSLEFRGRQVRWFAPRTPDGGIARVSLDGGSPTFVSLYAPAYEEPEVRVTFTFEDSGWHTITVRTTGQAQAASSGTAVRSDGFDYIW